MALGVVPDRLELCAGQPIDSPAVAEPRSSWSSGTATFLTNDPRFVMLKPSVIYCIVGAVMLKRGWMNRYLPPIAARPCRTSPSIFGYVWAGLMFGSAALNIVLALTLDAVTWAAAMSIWGIGSKIALFLIQYAVMTQSIGVRRAPARGASALYLNWTPTTS